MVVSFADIFRIKGDRLLTIISENKYVFFINHDFFD
jgi:hypothetical protein